MRHIDIEMLVKRKKFILRDPKKQEEEHVLQGHMGKHQGHSEGRRGKENAWSKAFFADMSEGIGKSK